jgi:hypothetical protein
MPYGLNLAPWDVLLSDEELESFFEQIAVINRARHHCLVLGAPWHEGGRLRTIMLAKGYMDTHVLTVIKPMQNTTGLSWINATEFLFVGYKGGVKECKLSFKDMHPLRRHNVLVGHQVGAKLLHVGTEDEVNPTQKNPNIATALGQVMCPPGGHALVLGAGSGSEVVGLARAGVNVVGVERDPRQFRAIADRVISEAAFPDAAMKKLASDTQSTELIGALMSRFTSLNEDVLSHFASADEQVLDLEEAAEQEAAVSSAVEPQSLVCPACGQVVSVLEAVACPKMGCPAATLHPNCCVRCSQCSKNFCADACKDDHGCA